MTSLRKMVEAKLDELVEYANTQILPKLNTSHPVKIQRPDIVYFRVGKKAGAFFSSKWQIELNEVLLEEYKEEFIEQTVTHEFAHACQHQWTPEDFTYGKKRSVHGHNFKRFMLMFGVQPTTYHNYDVSKCAKQTRKWKYVSKQNPNVVMFLGPQRHRKMQKGLATYYPRGYSNHTFVLEEQELPKAAMNAKTSTKKQTSKKDICKQIMSQNPSASRQWLIRQFMCEAKCTKAGASTYYYSLNK